MATNTETSNPTKAKDISNVGSISAKGSKPRKRAYHTKVRTGCITCKIRKVRCDEAKPSCSRCVSTGRKCDGYETRQPSPPSDSTSPDSVASLPSRPAAATPSLVAETSFQPISSNMSTNRGRLRPNATADLKLALSRTNPQELRSYRYFLEITAPAIAGCFDVRFWLEDIPRVCLSDPAIWHAIVALGSVHESYGTGGSADSRSSLARNHFALKQFNSAIRCLTEATSPRKADRIRALTVSAIFTCICILDGQYPQARMHATSGSKLLSEIEEDERQQRSLMALRQYLGPQKPFDPSDPPDPSSLSSWSIPISPSSIRSIILSYQAAETTFANGGFDDLPPLMMTNERFDVWTNYRAPSTSPSGQSPLTLENIAVANRASESLLHALGMWAHENGSGLKDLTAAPSMEALTFLIAKQRMYVPCFRHLQRAARIFDREFEAGQGEAKGADTPTRLVLKRSLLALCMYRDTSNYILIGDPDEKDFLVRYKSLPDICLSIVRSAEDIVAIETQLKAQGVPMPPGPPLATPLFTVAFGGYSWTARTRALELLQIPRLDGIWDSLMAASLAKAAMEREKEAAQEASTWGVDAVMAPASGHDTEGETVTLYRVYKIHAVFTGKREAELRLRTWAEVINGEPGRSSVVTW